MKTGATSLYVIVTGSADDLRGPAKFGISHHAGERLSNLQCGSPVPLVLLHQFPLASRRDALIAEGVLHQTYDRFWLHGEWFAIDPHTALVMAATVASLITGRGLKGDDFRKAERDCGADRALAFCEQRWPEFYKEADPS